MLVKKYPKKERDAAFEKWCLAMRVKGEDRKERPLKRKELKQQGRKDLVNRAIGCYKIAVAVSLRTLSFARRGMLPALGLSFPKSYHPDPEDIESPSLSLFFFFFFFFLSRPQKPPIFFPCFFFKRPDESEADLSTKEGSLSSSLALFFRPLKRPPNFFAGLSSSSSKPGGGSFLGGE